MNLQRYRENIFMGLDTLRTHRLRSLLTVLGIVIGISAVVVVASLLTGLRQNILSLIEQYGTENIYVFHLSSGFQSPSQARKERQREPLDLEDVQALREQSDYIESVGYNGIFLGAVTLKYRDREFTSAQLAGASPNVAAGLATTLAEGRFLSEIDDHNRRMVCVLGFNAVDALFPDQDRVVGKSVILRGNSYTIIGRLSESKTTFFGISTEDNNIYIPYRTFRKVYPRSDWMSIGIRARPGHLADAYDEAEAILRRSRSLRSNEDNDFAMNTYDSLVEQFDAIVQGIGLLTIAISSIGLLVGGIGVMNIMLVSVTERTREIGVRKALGAKRRDITFQFLFEAMTLTASGGVLGILISVGIASLLIAFIPQLPASIPIWAVFAGVGISAFVGLVFGVFPAVKASRLDPIECLRYE